MCELNAIYLKENNRQLIMESVTKILIDNDIIELKDILGDKKKIEGTIKEIDFSKGEIVILGK
ncbi:MAG: CooT family nickel-binding protein [Methanomethylovorans sp.]|nr:CooT family nickel-binding protein [Methanomethylovorans sp.]